MKRSLASTSRVTQAERHLPAAHLRKWTRTYHGILELISLAAVVSLATVVSFAGGRGQLAWRRWSGQLAESGQVIGVWQPGADGAVVLVGWLGHDREPAR